MKNKKMSLSTLLFEQDENQTIPTDVTPLATQQPQNYSLDQKVDHFLIQYERESNPSSAMFPDDSGLDHAIVSKGGPQSGGASFSGGQSAVATPIAMKSKAGIAERKKQNSLKSLLWEADDAAPGGADLGAAGGADLGGPPDLGGGPDLGGPDLGGGDDTQPPPVSDVSVAKPQINLSAFSNKLARLINNFESLVNPKVIVLNRAYAYIRQNYDENTAKEMMIILESTYNISNSSLEGKEENLVGEVPPAIGAGDGGGGAAGGA